MSIDNTSIQKVTSKYFSNKIGMDESLSDFQEKKQFAAPKQAKTKNKSNPNSKKSLRRPRGQKDIRTVLKSKTSDLVAYSKDFGNVCKQSGIDVDPEQLQLAIALSKSIQQPTSETQQSQSSSQERTARIRSTLQEYGFTVPEIKISNNNKKTKKHRKNYKLLLISELEKQKNISDKYSQILLQNISLPQSPTKKVGYSNSDSKLFYLTTNVLYDTIRNNNLFYLENLPLEKSAHKGALLRDWADIPGRPVSPKLREDSTMDVSEILCSQEELNVILSGTLKNVKNIINKVRGVRKSKDVDVEIIAINENSNNSNKDEVNNKSLSEKVESVITRSLSPDMFDDDHSGFQDSEEYTTIHDLAKNNLPNKSVILPSSVEVVHPTVSDQSQLSQRWNVTKRRSNDVMELTECVGTNSNPSSSSTLRMDITKRKSNDFMEITECITQQKGNIDLTKNPNETVIKEKQIEVVESINLTQSSDSNDALPFINVSGKNKDSLNDTVVLNDSKLNIVNRSPGKDGSIETTHVVDNDQFLESSNHLTSKTSLKKSVSVEDLTNNSFFEDFLYNHSNSPEQNNTIEKYQLHLDDNNEIEIDLTQSPEYNNDTLQKPVFEIENKNKSDCSQNSRVYEAGIYKNEQNDSHVKDNAEIDLTQSPEYNNDTLEHSKFEIENKDDIDLTQNSITSEEVDIDNKNSLGRINNVSIDYDELSTSNAMSSINKTNVYNVSEVINSEEAKNSLSITKSITTNSSNKHSENLDTSQSSQASEVFEISDKELDYSMHKSRFDDCFEVNFDGISVIDENSEVKKDEDSDSYKCASDSFLPEVNIKTLESPNKPGKSGISPIRLNDFNDIINTPKNVKDINKNHDLAKESCIGITPFKKNDGYDIVKTPSNNEYVVKTDQVTPMGNYNDMSTPDRNKELDKYGLKPLKRKRAIQLLTHIYNQTHPIVEPCTSESQSPTKKRKIESAHVSSPAKSPRNIPEHTKVKKQTSPNKRKKYAVSPMKVHVNYEIKENIYEVTNERVEVKNIVCPEDEWVFQKREKSKVQSCRVPLHIAFHNYVSCRRGLQEAILRYEPVDIDVIHKGLAANECRYDPKDLLKFLDKKCITVKTADNNARNKN